MAREDNLELEEDARKELLKDAVLPSSEEKAEFLKYTNLYRCMHGVPPIEWNDDLELATDAYIDPIKKMEHSPPSDRQGGTIGENLYSVDAPQVPNMKVLKPSPRHIVRSWYSEILDCADGCTDGCMEGTAVPPGGVCLSGDFGKGGRCQVGHFRAMIWQSLTTMACAFSWGDAPWVVGCRYTGWVMDVSGKPQSFYVPNVKKSAAECGGNPEDEAGRTQDLQVVPKSPSERSTDVIPETKKVVTRRLPCGVLKQRGVKVPEGAECVEINLNDGLTAELMQILNDLPPSAKDDFMGEIVKASMSKQRSIKVRVIKSDASCGKLWQMKIYQKRPKFQGGDRTISENEFCK